MASSTNGSGQMGPSIEIDLLGMIRRRWSHLVFGVAVGVSLAALYYCSTTPTYESNIEILVGQRSSELTNRGTMSGANASGEAIQEDQLATHMRLFAGRRLVAKAIDVGNLRQVDSIEQAANNGSNLIDHILDNLEVQRGGEGSASDAMVLRATYQDTDPEDAALILAALYESYREYVESHGENSSKQAVQLIEDARETHEAELANADQEYREFVQAVPVLMEGDKIQDIHKDRLARIETELNEVRSSLSENESRLQVIESYRDSNGDRDVEQMDHLALLSQKEVERLKLFLDMSRGHSQSEAFQAEQPMRAEVARAQYNRLLDLIQKEIALSDAYGPGHPLVEAARQETAITRQYLEANSPDVEPEKRKDLDPAEMLDTYTMLLRNDISELTKREEILLDESANELRLAKKLEGDVLKGESLRAALNRAQSRYDEVIRRLQELNLTRSYAGFSTDLLATPEAAKNAAWPSLPIVGALGLCFGLGLGLVIALTAELFDSTFSNVQDLENAVGAPAIAHVPRFDAREMRDRVDPDSLVEPSLIAFHAPRAAESEVYRVARTSLMVSNRKGSVQTMMMTSPQPGDGKSTTISNLAISFARAGKRVLLIDADMRRPVIAGLFGITDQPGLSDVLMGEKPLEEAAVESVVPGLSILPNGQATSVPAELLESQRLTLMLKEARRSYDLVLIDAPPLLAVADPAIIAPSVDSVVLTVRVNKNGRRPVENAVRILEDIEVTPVAVIVNGVDSEAKKSYGYGSYSRDHYGYVGHYHNQYAAKDVKPPREGVPRPHAKPARVAG